MRTRAPARPVSYQSFDGEALEKVAFTPPPTTNPPPPPRDHQRPDRDPRASHDPLARLPRVQAPGGAPRPSPPPPRPPPRDADAPAFAHALRSAAPRPPPRPTRTPRGAPRDAHPPRPTPPPQQAPRGDRRRVTMSAFGAIQRPGGRASPRVGGGLVEADGSTFKRPPPPRRAHATVATRARAAPRPWRRGTPRMTRTRRRRDPKRLRPCLSSGGSRPRP